MLVVVFGLPGSGKSYFASRLAKRLGAVYLGSDAMRRGVVGKPHYSPDEKQRVYDAVAARASEDLRDGRSVVLDATFHTAVRRRRIAELAAGADTQLRWIEVHAADPVIRERLARKRPDSDADYAVHEAIRREFEPMSGDHLRLESTQHNLDVMLEQALEYLRA
jgi:predicted kinase